MEKTQIPSNPPTTEPVVPPAAPPATSAAPPIAPPSVLPPAVTEPPPAPPPAIPEPPATDKKRKLEDGELQNSYFFKIRAILRDLRPSFVEVLRAPSFRNCQAAHDIRIQTRLMIELSKELRVEATASGMFKKPAEGQSPAGECKEEIVEKCGKEEKKGEQLQPHQNLNSDDLKVLIASDEVSEKAPEMISEAVDLEMLLQGLEVAYAVGGSPIGWNFLVYSGSKPVYYGITKETARLRRPSTQV